MKWPFTARHLPPLPPPIAAPIASEPSCCKCGHSKAQHLGGTMSCAGINGRYDLCLCRRFKRVGDVPPTQPVSQEIPALRGWSLATNANGDAVLISVSHPVFWPGPSLTADVVPDEDNQNGIYALTPESFTGSGYAGSQVTGEVALSGIVVVGEKGYRAERAAIRSLQVRHGTEDCAAIELLAPLEERYQCPVSLWTAPPAVREVTMTRPYYDGSSMCQRTYRFAIPA